MKVLRTIWYGGLYYASWLFFGLGGLGLNLVCIPLLLVPRRERLAAPTRRALHGVFALWLRWLRVCGVVRVSWRGFDDGPPLPVGAVYVANHPTLVDATFLLGRMRNTVCIFKPALLRHPLIGPAAVLAGYPMGDQGVDTVRQAAEAVGRGCSLLVFPEGTRTEPGRDLNPLKPGFALIARRAHAPIQVVHVESAGDLVPRGRPWWRLPQLPSRVTVTRGQLVTAHPSTPLPLLVAEVEAQLRTRPAGARAESCLEPR